MHKKIECLSSGKDRARTKEKVKVVLELRQIYPFEELLDYFKMPKSTYYYVVKTLQQEDSNKDLKDEILTIYNENKQVYGYRRMTLAVNKNREIKINHKKIFRLMKELGIYGHQAKNTKYHSYKGDNGEFKENLLLEKTIDKNTNRVIDIRHFETAYPNEKWTTDVSEFKHKSGEKLYLSPIMDMYDSTIIAYDLSTHPNFEQTIRMLKKAFEDNPNIEGLIFHSDQGWQYQMKQYKVILSSKGIKQSFSRKGNCMDNSLMENFFGIMKNEMFYGHENEFETLDDLAKAIHDYIKWYNEKRINLKRKGLSPLEYRQQALLELQY